MSLRKIFLILGLFFICTNVVFAQVDRAINYSDTTLVKFLDELIKEKESESKLFAEKIQEYEVLVEQMKGAYDKTIYDLAMLKKRKEAFQEGEKK